MLTQTTILGQRFGHSFADISANDHNLWPFKGWSLKYALYLVLRPSKKQPVTTWPQC